MPVPSCPFRNVVGGKPIFVRPVWEYSWYEARDVNLLMYSVNRRRMLASPWNWDIADSTCLLAAISASTGREEEQEG